MPTTSIYIRELKYRTSRHKRNYDKLPKDLEEIHSNVCKFQDIYICGKKIYPTTNNVNEIKERLDTEDRFDTLIGYSRSTFWKVDYSYELNSDGYAILEIQRYNESRNVYGEPVRSPPHIIKVILRGESKIQLDLEKCVGLVDPNPPSNATIKVDKVFGNGDRRVTFHIKISEFTLKQCNLSSYGEPKSRHVMLLLTSRGSEEHHIGLYKENRDLGLTANIPIKGDSTVKIDFTANIHTPHVEKMVGIFKKRLTVVPEYLELDSQLMIDATLIGQQKLSLSPSRNEYDLRF